MFPSAPMETFPPVRADVFKWNSLAAIALSAAFVNRSRDIVVNFICVIVAQLDDRRFNQFFARGKPACLQLVADQAFDFRAQCKSHDGNLTAAIIAASSCFSAMPYSINAFNMDIQDVQDEDQDAAFPLLSCISC